MSVTKENPPAGWRGRVAGQEVGSESGRALAVEQHDPAAIPDTAGAVDVNLTPRTGHQVIRPAPAQTVLTIDDDPAVRESIAAYLRDCDFRTIEADNGVAGIRLFQEARPDLVLVDLRMPEADGFEVLSAITRRAPQTPIIVVSGTGVIADAVEALRSGAWDYVLKPIEDMGVLLHSVQRCLERARLRRENEAYQRHLEETLKKIKDDEEAGRKIQSKLLPPAISVLGPYSLTRHVMPSMDLSGDFVDYFNIDDEHVAFYTADVSGHGVSSALVTVLLKSFIRKQLERHANRNGDTILRPGALLQMFNEELLEEDLDKHVTMLYGVLHVPENTLTFANGGQFPYPIIWSNHTCETIKEKGRAVGLFPRVTFQDVHRPLPEQFLLAVFSDGVLDVLPQPTLAEKLGFLEKLGSETTIADFVTRLRSHTDLPDDITVLTIKRGNANGSE